MYVCMYVCIYFKYYFELMNSDSYTIPIVEPSLIYLINSCLFVCRLMLLSLTLFEGFVKIIIHHPNIKINILMQETTKL